MSDYYGPPTFEQQYARYSEEQASEHLPQALQELEQALRTLTDEDREALNPSQIMEWLRDEQFPFASRLKACGWIMDWAKRIWDLNTANYGMHEKLGLYKKLEQTERNLHKELEQSEQSERIILRQADDITRLQEQSVPNDASTSGHDLAGVEAEKLKIVKGWAIAKKMGTKQDVYCNANSITARTLRNWSKEFKAKGIDTGWPER